MSDIISREDYGKLQKLSLQHGRNIKFKYTDAAGKQTDVDSNVDSTTVLEGSILTHNAGNGYRRYLFSRMDSDVEAD